MAAGGNRKNITIGPGRWYRAPLGTAEPTSASAALPSAFWTPVGYTEDGSEVTTDITTEDIEVAEELDPIDTLATRRTTTVTINCAESTVANMATALGGDVSRTNDAVAYEFPDPSSIVGFMLVHDSEEDPTATGTDGALNRRWLFRNCKPTGSGSTANRKAPQKKLVPITVRANKPDNGGSPVKIFPDALGRI